MELGLALLLGAAGHGHEADGLGQSEAAGVTERLPESGARQTAGREEGEKCPVAHVLDGDGDGVVGRSRAHQIERVGGRFTRCCDRRVSAAFA